jgi:hypothetical protein
LNAQLAIERPFWPTLRLLHTIDTAGKCSSWRSPLFPHGHSLVVLEPCCAHDPGGPRGRDACYRSAPSRRRPSGSPAPPVRAARSLGAGAMRVAPAAPRPPLPPSWPGAGDRPQRRGGWPCARFCTRPRACPPGRPPRRCAAGSRGRPPWGENAPSPAWLGPSAAHGARAGWWATPQHGAWRPGWRVVALATGGQGGAGRGRRRRRGWGRAARAPAWWGAPTRGARR